MSSREVAVPRPGVNRGAIVVLIAVAQLVWLAALVYGVVSLVS